VQASAHSLVDHGTKSDRNARGLVGHLPPSGGAAARDVKDIPGVRPTFQEPMFRAPGGRSRAAVKCGDSRMNRPCRRPKRGVRCDPRTRAGSSIGAASIAVSRRSVARMQRIPRPSRGQGLSARSRSRGDAIGIHATACATRSSRVFRCPLPHRAGRVSGTGPESWLDGFPTRGRATGEEQPNRHSP
jgi:hypothetical protein